MTLRLYQGSAARQKLLEGVGQLTRLVEAAVGPEGRTLLAGRKTQAPQAVQSGYEIAREFGAGLGGAVVTAMRDMAWRMKEDLGDGSSTAILLAGSLISEIERARSSGIEASLLLPLILDQANRIAQEVKRDIKPLAGFELGIATRAARGDVGIGSLVASAFRTAGDSGSVQIVASRTVEDSTEVIDGMEFDAGWLSPGFVSNDGDDSITLEKPLILIHHGGIDSFLAVAPVLEMIAKSGRTLLIVADEILPEAMSTLLINKRRGGLRVAVMKSPGAGLWRLPLLEDLAAATGGAVISPFTGGSLASLKPSMLGQAAAVTVLKDRTQFVGMKGDPQRIAERKLAIEHELAIERHFSFDREQHRKRLARFGGKSVRIKLGGVTELDQNRRMASATAAISSLQASFRGIVGGGPFALIRANSRAEKNGDLSNVAMAATRHAFRKAMAKPAIAILSNSGLDAASILARLRDEPDAAFDITTRTFVAADTLPVPASVLLASIAGAVSLATAFFNVEVCLIN